MIPESTIFLLSSVAHALVFVALVLWLTRIEDSGRLVGFFVAGVVGIAVPANLLMALDVGNVAIVGGVVSLPFLLNDLVAYTGFFVLSGVLAGASRPLVGAIGVTTVVQRIAFELAHGGFVEGLGALAAAGVVGGWLFVFYLFLRPLWSAAQDVPSGQRLLHWKCRDLLLFLVGMLIVFGLLILAGVFDPFVGALTAAYFGFLIRAGLAGFIFANAGEISEIGLDAPVVRHVYSPSRS